jgi:hypothetical protein
MPTIRRLTPGRFSARLSMPATLALAICMLAAPSAAAAQGAQAAPAPAPQAEDDPDLDPNPSQPDFTLITLPTTLRLPRHKSAFRVTHRFTRSLSQGDFGSLAEDFFALDSSGLIGLEYRFGVMRGLQAGVRRTSDRTIEFLTQYSLLQQREGLPVGIDVAFSIDGTNNFRDMYTPAIGAVVSHELGAWGAVYVTPTWVGNTNPLPGDEVDDNDTLLVGLGARLRVRPTIYVLAEIIPRTGFEPGANHTTFAVEKRAGGHVFQLNFSNGLGTTMGQIARGGTSYDDWYLGFSISRKFF